jgi:hypothetical protein
MKPLTQGARIGAQLRCIPVPQVGRAHAGGERRLKAKIGVHQVVVRVSLRGDGAGRIRGDGCQPLDERLKVCFQIRRLQRGRASSLALGILAFCEAQTSQSGANASSSASRLGGCCADALAVWLGMPQLPARRIQAFRHREITKRLHFMFPGSVAALSWCILAASKARRDTLANGRDANGRTVCLIWLQAGADWGFGCRRRLLDSPGAVLEVIRDLHGHGSVRGGYRAEVAGEREREAARGLPTRGRAGVSLAGLLHWSRSLIEHWPELAGEVRLHRP